MDKYTYSNLIIDPTKEGIESLIGKEVYCHDNPCLCLKNANKKSTDFLGVLMEIHKYNNVPFCVKQKYGVYKYTCIIEKKEEPKPKYVPFESIEEFLTAYFKSVANSECIQKTISSTGIWLKHNDAFLLVVEIWDRGVVIGDINMQTTEIDEDEYITVHGVTKWKELLEDYTFLDGSPCGKEVK